MEWIDFFTSTVIPTAVVLTVLFFIIRGIISFFSKPIFESEFTADYTGLDRLNTNKPAEKVSEAPIETTVSAEEEAEEKQLAYICDNDDWRMAEARRNAKYKQYLTELKHEEEIGNFFADTYDIHFTSIYRGELLVDWETFGQQLTALPDDLPREYVIDAMFYLMITAARSIRGYSSSRPDFEDIWSEQVYNQIRSVIEAIVEDIRPIFLKGVGAEEENRRFHETFEELRDYFKGVCRPDDDYWIFVLNHIEDPLKHALKIAL
jgi:hypothetical protein